MKHILSLLGFLGVIISILGAAGAGMGCLIWMASYSTCAGFQRATGTPTRYEGWACYYEHKGRWISEDQYRWIVSYGHDQ